jgi:hypothetical protein
MVINRPWQSATDDAWDTVVTPWLTRAENTFTARPFLDAALRSAQAISEPLVLASLSWLSRRIQQTDADYVIRGLLSRNDLKPEHKLLTVAYALDWVRDHFGWPAVPRILNKLLKLDHSPEILHQVADCTLNWISVNRPAEAGDVLGRLLDRTDVLAEQRLAGVKKGLAWLASHPDAASEATPFLLALLRCRDLTDELLHSFLEYVFIWLARNLAIPGAGSVIRGLLEGRKLDPASVRKIASYADTWIAQYPTGSVRDGILRALLAREETLNVTERLLNEVASRPSDPSIAPVLQRLLEHDLIGEQARAAVDHAVKWLADNEASAESHKVIQPLLRHTALTPEKSQHVINCGVAELRREPGQPTLISSLLSLPDDRLTSSQAHFVIELSLEWAPSQGIKSRRPVISSLLDRRDLTSDQAARSIELGLDLLMTSLSGKDVSMVRALLRRRDLNEAQQNRAVRFAMRWLAAYGTLRKARFVLFELMEHPCLSVEAETAAAEHAEEWIAAYPEEEAAKLLRLLLRDTRHARLIHPTRAGGAKR